MATGEEVQALLGSEANSAAIQSLKAEGSWEVKTFPASKTLAACQFHNCKEKGLQLCFEQDPTGSSWELSAVHFYNEGVEGFSKFQGEPLPFGLSMSHTNAEIVSLLGEPEKKGGIDVPVWISYQAHALQVNFKGFSFEDRSNPIASIVVFRP
mmetsp:Transcript_31434/g.74146  ORF Transcript_31434/g.74146 Transcript_31434/m.74146 type:complete len:153 (-) Transcript_31434:38-496(-)